MAFNYLIIAACLILGGFLIYKEVSRPDKGWLVARLVASVLAVVSLAFMVIPLTYTADKVTKANELIILTPGTNLDSLSKAENSDLYTSDSNFLAENKSRNVKYIPDISYFLKANPDINTLQVYGYGLSLEQLRKLNSYQVHFHFPLNRPSGITSCNWNSTLKSSESLFVQGVYKNISAKPVKLVLKGLGSTLDSQVVEAKKYSRFSFKTIPAQIGKAVYELIALSGKDTLKTEKIPFEVTGSQQMKILILASSPDFEYKFLKNWLYENKYPLSIRTTISKNKYSTDYLNMESNDLGHINANLLQKFDIVISDETELSSLNASEKSTLYNNTEQGLGLIIRVNDERPASSFSNSFTFYSSSEHGDQTFTPEFLNKTQLKPLSVEKGMYIKAQNGEQPIITDENSRILVSSKIYGLGKVIASAIPSTYSWMLAGNQREYSAFWSELISTTARADHATESWKITPEFPIVRQQAEVILEKDSDNDMPFIKVNNISLSAQQNSEMPFLWSSTFWPDRTGWNVLSLKDEKSKSFYVYNKYDWMDVKNEKLLSVNELFNNKNIKTEINSLELGNSYKKEVGKWIFFTIFFISISFLWFELRFISNN